MPNFIAIVALALWGFASRADAQDTSSALMLVPMAEDRNAEIRAEIDVYLQSKTDAGFDYGMQFGGVRGRVKLLPKLGFKSPRLGFEALYLDTDTLDPRIPDSLSETAVAVGFGLGPPISGWQLIGTLGVGFAGDNAYTGSGWYGLASVSAFKAFSKKSFLSIGLDFDGNRVIWPDVPIPVVTWTYIQSETLRWTFGFPIVSLTWDPVDWFTLDFTFIPPIRAVGGFTFHVGPKWDIFLRYRGANFAFTVNSNPRDNERLFYSEERVELGVAYRPSPKVELKATAGWAFERRFRSGFDVRSTDNVAILEKDAVFALICTVAF